MIFGCALEGQAASVPFGRGCYIGRPASTHLIACSAERIRRARLVSIVSGKEEAAGNIDEGRDGMTNDLALMHQEHQPMDPYPTKR